ncbi:MAG: thiamine phosphate synthase [Bacteroidales bacterium]|nr:thiamine phosphate synthase [Bacteroidales bacterium]
MDKKQLELYLVTDRNLCLGRDLESVVEEAVKGGVTIVQLREKDCSTAEFIKLAQRLKTILKPYKVPLLINDRIDVALAVDADGVHIGQSDMPYEIARKLLGRDKIIGVSAENIDDIRKANLTDADYVAISPVYATPTKTDTSKPFGLEGTARAVETAIIPTCAIGGLNKETIPAVTATGVDSIAVVSAICSAASPKVAAAELLSVIRENKPQPSKGKWTAEAWRGSEKIYEDICAHPFITELASGTLAQEKFMRYIAQDEVYLKAYGDHMYKLADMLPEGDMKAMFYEFAKSGMEMEHAMHELLIERFNIDLKVEGSHVTKAYNDHTGKCIESGVLEVALASMLPCMWIYNEVGLYIYNNRNKTQNPYTEWVEAYSSEEFTDGVKAVLDMCDELADKASDEIRAEMTEAFHKAAFYEWAFWDYGYYGE